MTVNRKVVTTNFEKVDYLEGRLTSLLTTLNANHVKALAFNSSMTPRMTKLLSYYDTASDNAYVKDLKPQIDAELVTVNAALTEAEQANITFDEMMTALDDLTFIKPEDYISVELGYVLKYIKYSSNSFSLDDTAFLGYVTECSVCAYDDTEEAS